MGLGHRGTVRFGVKSVLAMESITNEAPIRKRPFWRFFAMLMAAQLLTVGVTVLLLGLTTRLWVREQARGFAEMLPKMVAQLDEAEIEKIKPSDTPGTNPAYKSVVRRLAELYKTYLPDTGHQLSIAVVKGDKEAKIAEPDDDDDQRSVVTWFPAEPYALEALQNRVTYSPYPYATSNRIENITAYAPIVDATGKVRFLLNIDRDTSSLGDILRVVRYSFLLAVIPATLVSVMLAAFLSARFVDVFEFLRSIHERTLRRDLPEAPESGEPCSSSEAAESHAPDPSLLVEESVKDEVEGLPLAGEPSPPSWVDAPNDARWASLTERERETATLSYLKYKEIAERMGISVEGVKKHSQNARAKLGVRDRVEMALYAVRMGALGQSVQRADEGDCAHRITLW